MEFIKDEKTISILLALIVSIIGYFIVELLILRLTKKVPSKIGPKTVIASVRAKTIQKVLLSLSKAFFILFFLFSFLQTMGVDIKALIISAGVFGLAISLGSQNIVKDLINGLIILVENQIALGDTVEINNMQGIVSNVTLRYILLIDEKARMTFIPFGNISQIKNYRLSQEEGIFEKLDKRISDFLPELNQIESDMKDFLIRTGFFENITTTLFVIIYGEKPEKAHGIIFKVAEEKGLKLRKVNINPLTRVLLTSPQGISTGEDK